ncbi:MAG: hypothetical protein IOC92_17275 [Rhodobacter sp.]|nr:hypothetical protein [Rhodobacter sp.]MCA3458141.1 hypothetical protein [Rhodobacter sp.]MCA3462557.1 hypothetical protein [Rhodobacter sp.]MCA3465435.1 hypothetical protein [Rhodobacter sp.]MCA3466233.1 hypothetical protein [Rhodobacter sp.]
MTSRLSLLFASTALTVALGLPALAAMQTQDNPSDQCSGVCAAVSGAKDLSEPLLRVSADDDDDSDDGGDCGDDDDDDEDDDDDDEDGDGDDCTGAKGNPAPAGTVAPPANGLFGTGAPPVAVTN